MIRGALSEIHPLTKIVIAFAIILIFFLVFSLLGAIIAVLVFDINLLDITSLLNDYSDPKVVGIMKLLQIIQSFGLFIIPPFLVGILLYKSIPEFLGFDRKPYWMSILLCGLILVVTIPFINLLGEFNSRLDLPGFMQGIENWMKQTEEQAGKLTEAFLHVNSRGGVWMNLLVVAILPAIGEELLFRGVVQRQFADWTKNIHAGIWIAALFFSAVHMQFYGFIPRLLMGALFGYMMVWGGSIWLPIFAHFVNNGVAVVFYYFYDLEKVDKNLENIGTPGEMVYMALISLLLAATLVMWFYRIETERRRRLQEAVN